MLKLTIARYLKSYQFKAEADEPDSFQNNWKNNSLDDFILLNDDTELFKCKCQSVANYCFGEMQAGETVNYGDSVAAGGFTVDNDYKYVVEISDKQTLHNYIDFTIEAMQSGLFSFLAHPDLFLSNRTVIDADCIACADALIDAANAEKLPLEINGYGLFKPKIDRNYGLDYRYPVSLFWERAAAKNAHIICNSDAHETAHVIAGTRKAFEYARRLGITPTDSADALGFARLQEPV